MELIDNEEDMVRNGRWLEAIKAVRARTGAGLKEAQDAVERHRVRMEEEHRTQPRQERASARSSEPPLLRPYTLPHVVREKLWLRLTGTLGLGGFGGVLILASHWTQRPDAMILGVPFAVFGLLYPWWISPRIVLHADRLTYRKPFSRRDVRYADITDLRVTEERPSSPVSGGAPGGLAGELAVSLFAPSSWKHHFLDIHAAGWRKPLHVGVDQFTARNVAILIDAAATHAPTLTLSDAARALRDGMVEPARGR